MQSSGYWSTCAGDRDGGMRIDMPSTCGAEIATATGAIMWDSTLGVPQIYQCRSFAYPNVLRVVAYREGKRKRKIGQRGDILVPRVRP